MSKSVRIIVECKDPGDGSEDVIIDLPSDVLAAVNVGSGDSLSIELVNEAILLRPIRDADTRPSGSYRPQSGHATASPQGFET